ncbi:hypothetical protein KIN20_000803 [Parelaphostrongylus tenuis]|uniref:Uncharacterized protein n=1 Tax=Parelaphostrongylus tenuis TaxID=148309 RepID=A0AAD5MEB8_PARTN|nr:hypothetical protein KIN20_000803 [Parelaphostrongylus tenuis]
MLGIMNVGSDASVEFYASASQNSIYDRRPSRDIRTYTNEGRVLINGVPEVQDSADELWRSIISKAVSREVMTEYTQEKKGPIAIIRRISSRALSSQKPNVTPMAEEIEEDQEESEDKRKNVTIVRIKTTRKDAPRKIVKRRRNDDVDEDGDDVDEDGDDDDVDMNNSATDGQDGDVDDDGEEVRIYADENILKCLMKERAMIEREMGKISMEWAIDQDPVIVDDMCLIVLDKL